MFRQTIIGNLTTSNLAFIYNYLAKLRQHLYVIFRKSLTLSENLLVLPAVLKQFIPC